MESLVQNFGLETESHFQAKKVRNHYPSRLRELAVDCFEEGRSRGFSLNRVANLLGVRPITLENWCGPKKPRTPEKATHLVPVVIASRTPSRNSSVVRIETSSGIFTEFDCVEEAAKSFRLLEE